MPEIKPIDDILKDEYNLDIDNLSDHNKIIQMVGNIMSKLCLTNTDKIILVLKYEYIAKLRFNHFFTRKEVLKFNISNYTKTELEKIKNGETTDKIIGDTFWVDEDDNYLYVINGNDKIKIEDGNYIIFNMYDEWEIFKTLEGAKKYYNLPY